MRIFFVGLLALAFMSGCATVDIKQTRLNTNKPLAQGHGVVVLQVVNNAQRLAALHKGWTEVIAFRTDNMKEIENAAIEKAKAEAAKKGKAFNPEKVDWEPEFYSFTPVAEGTIDSQLFMGSMPEGTYMVSTLYSFYSDGNMSSWITMPVMYSAGKFNVVPNQMTELGTLVFQPLLNVKNASFWSNSSSMKAYVTRVNESQNLGEFVLSHYPVISANLDTSTRNGWQDDDLNEYRTKLSELSRENAYSSRAVAMANSGNAALVAKFGQVRVRQNDNTWQNFNLPTNAQMSAVLDFEDTIYVGGERGQLFVQQPDMQWQLHHPVSQKEAIIWMAQTEERGYALTSSAKNYTVYSFEKPLSQWVETGSFVKKNANDWLVQNGGLFAFITSHKTLRIVNDNKMYDLKADGTWAMKPTDSMRDLAKVGDNILVGLEVSQWDGVGDQVYSTDNGDTWIQVSRRLKLFGDNKTDTSLPAYTLEKGLVTLGRVKDNNGRSHLKIIATKETKGNKTYDWFYFGEPKDGCYVILPELTHEETLYFLCDQGEIVSTQDYGNSWQTEIELDVAKMQVEFEKFIEEMKLQIEKEKAEEQQSNGEPVETR